MATSCEELTHWKSEAELPAAAEAAVPGLVEAEVPAAAEAAVPGLVEAELPAAAEAEVPSSRPREAIALSHRVV